MKPTRVYLSVQPVRAPRSMGARSLISREPHYRASWWTRGTSTELYRSRTVPSQVEAVRLALRWFERKNQEAAGRPLDTQLIDTTEQPERFGYALGPETKPVELLEHRSSNEEKLTKLIEELKDRTQHSINSGRGSSMSDYNTLRDCEIALGETGANEHTVARARARLANRMGVSP